MDRIHQPSTPDSPDTAVRRALTAMANELADTNPDQQLINPGRVALALRATVDEPAGTFDQILVLTAPIGLPQARSDYAACLREITVSA